MTKNFFRNWFLPLVALGMATFAMYHLLTAAEVLPPQQPPITPATAISLERVSGTGMVEPRTESVSVGTAQSGVVLEVYYADDSVGREIKKGEPLFKVDDRAWQAQLRVHRATLNSAKAELQRLEQMPRPEDLPPLEAKVQVAKARLADQEDRFQRVQQLPNAAIAREEVTQRRFSFEAAQHEMIQAQKELDRVKAGAWQPELAVAQAAVEAAEANIHLVETEIDRCLVRAPIDGQVLQVNVRPGEYVSGQSSKTLFMLGDLNKLHVRAEFDEEDIPRFNRDYPARAVTRGNASKSFALKFLRIEPYIVPKRSLTGDGIERVDTRVMQVVFEVEDSAAPLLVGQQLDVFVEKSNGKGTGELAKQP